MTVKKYLLAGALVGFLSLFYNYLVFAVLKFYPDYAPAWSWLGNNAFNFYFFIFLKNFLVGLILTILYALGYQCVRNDRGLKRDSAKMIFFFSLYAIFALLAFSIGDIFLMGSDRGLLVLLTVDGMVESLIATMPIRFFVGR